jgi:YesN/AraC family two-component response regulator
LLGDLRASRPGLPVVMLTGYGSEWICASAFKLGVKDYFPKPVSACDLISAVHRILSRKAAGPEPSSPRAPDFSIQKAVGLIQQRFWDRLSLNGVASAVGMSKFWLSHRFRDAMGITFRDYLTQVRLERAKALLATGDASITEVAQMVGFGDLPRFDKLFKRYTGLTPSAYRIQHRSARNP